MICHTTRAIIAFCLLSTRLTASAAQQHDLWLEVIQDITLRSELAQLGPYPETSGLDTVVLMNRLPLRSASALHVELFGSGLRVRLEVQPFVAGREIERTRSGYRFDREPILGWEPGAYHTRVSRVELVSDGIVCQVPTTAFMDLFDMGLDADGHLWAQAARSADGYRSYVLVQVGEGHNARAITWVFDDGRYLFRVVDPVE